MARKIAAQGGIAEQDLKIPKFSLWQSFIGALSGFIPGIRDNTTFAAAAEARCRMSAETFAEDDVSLFTHQEQEEKNREVESWVRGFDEDDAGASPQPALQEKKKVIESAAQAPFGLQAAVPEEEIEELSSEYLEEEVASLSADSSADGLEELPSEYLEEDIDPILADTAEEDIEELSADWLEEETDSFVEITDDQILASAEAAGESAAVPVPAPQNGISAEPEETPAAAASSASFVEALRQAGDDIVRRVRAEEAADWAERLERSLLMPYETFHENRRAVLGIPEGWRGRPVLHLSSGPAAPRLCLDLSGTSPENLAESLRFFMAQAGQPTPLRAALNGAADNVRISYLPPIDASGQSLDGPVRPFRMNQGNRESVCAQLVDFLASKGFIGALADIVPKAAKSVAAGIRDFLRPHAPTDRGGTQPRR